MNRGLIVSLLVPIFSLVTGCAASVGKGSFSCEGISDGVGCEKASTVYEVADKPEFEDGVTASGLNAYRNGQSSPTNQPNAGELSRRGSGVPISASQTRSGTEANRFFGKEPILAPNEPDQLFILNPPVADPTEPLRSQREIQRVWIAPWVSNDGVWHGQQVIYVETNSREWQNGVINSQTAIPIFKPLESE